MGRTMKNAPVYFTVGQIRYNPVLSLSSYIPVIQEHFRKDGFPDFKRGLAMTFNLAPLLQDQKDEAQAPPTVPVERYSFSNLSNTMNFLLEQSSLTLQATEYHTFDVFAEHLLRRLEFLHKTVGLSYIERIGVRYLDAVMPREGETLSQYLIPEVMGLYGKLSGQTEHSFSETLTKGENGVVISRTVIQQGQVGFPPDLVQLMTLKIEKRFEQFLGTHAIIDTDAFFAERLPFDLAEAGRRLELLHDRTGKSFRQTVTEHAMTVWA